MLSLKKKSQGTLIHTHLVSARKEQKHLCNLCCCSRKLQEKKKNITSAERSVSSSHRKWTCWTGRERCHKSLSGCGCWSVWPAGGRKQDETTVSAARNNLIFFVHCVHVYENKQTNGYLILQVFLWYLDNIILESISAAEVGGLLSHQLLEDEQQQLVVVFTKRQVASKRLGDKERKTTARLKTKHGIVIFHFKIHLSKVKNTLQR